jgi:hypothetical protein
MEPPLPGRRGQPPWSLTAHLGAHVAVALAAAALLTGTAGLALTLLAAHGGGWASGRPNGGQSRPHSWLPPPRVLLLAGIAVAVLLAFLPPFGSADHLSYAAYGRMAATGHDPYATGPDVLARLGDPVARAVRRWGDWQATPSVYGPLATAGQALAALIGGTSVRATVFVLSLLNVTAFAGTGLLLHRLARGDQARQLRAALLWTLNPLLLYELVAGAHVDTQMAVFAVAAVGAFAMTKPNGSRGAPGPGAARCLLAGALVGLAFAVKLTGALAGGGLAWAVIRGAGGRESRVRQLAGLAAGFVAVAGAAMALAGPHALGQVLRGSSYVSISSPWRVVRTVARLAFGHSAAATLVSAGSAVLALALLVVLLRGLPPARNSPARAARPALAFVLAWLFAWPYVLPWYDALGWALLPLVAWSWVDWVLLARTAALAVGYLPARAAVRLPADLGWLQSVVRTGFTPLALTAALAALVVASRRGRAPRSSRQPANDGEGTGNEPTGNKGTGKEGTLSRWLPSRLT